MSVNRIIVQSAVKLESWLPIALRIKFNLEVVISISQRQSTGKIKKTETAQMQDTFKLSLSVLSTVRLSALSLRVPAGVQFSSTSALRTAGLAGRAGPITHPGGGSRQGSL